MNQLNQPIVSDSPEPNHTLKNVLTVAEFINLLKEEEDYWAGEQHNTKLMITRLRKIFYDKWGWNKELIEGAAKIDTRYDVEIVDNPTEHTKPITRYTQFNYDPKHRAVLYTDHDKVFGNTRVGQTPFIYQNDHQETRLPDGSFCDVAHVLAGLDAFNYHQVVTPLPHFLRFMTGLFPHVDNNMDLVTWLGDLGSSAGDFVFTYLRSNKKALTEVQEEDIIDVDAPGSDILGDMDPFVIKEYYNVSTNNGQRITEILEDYYLTDNIHRLRRYSIFSKTIGLQGWNGHSFKNEAEWLRSYRRQLRDDITFEVFSKTNEKITSVWLPIYIWFGGYKDVIKVDLLLNLFLKSLKELVRRESMIS